MKKLIPIILVLTVVFSACGSTGKPETTPAPTEAPKSNAEKTADAMSKMDEAAAELIDVAVDELEVERDETTIAILRAAFAQAQSDYLFNGKVNPEGYVIEVRGEHGDGLDISGFNFTCDDNDLLKKLDNNEGGEKVTVTFEFDKDGNGVMKAQ